MERVSGVTRDMSVQTMSRLMVRSVCGACENFHKSLVKKFTSTNTGMDAICPNCGEPLKVNVEVLVKQHHT